MITKRPPLHKVTARGKEVANRIVNRYKRPVFTDRVGRMKIEVVDLKYEAGFKAVQPAHYPVPYHYHERLAMHLAPDNPKRKTHLVTDASLCGIATSLYQEDDQGKWGQLDNTSRALSGYKQGWESQIDWESLAKVWGMMMFQPYLIGVHFTS